MKKKVLFIINPVSGKIKVRESLFDVLHGMSECGAVPTVLMTKKRGDATVMAAECAKSGKFDAIFCCGGDGTLNEVITGVISSGVPLPIGYIPAGSTNDFAAALGLSLNMHEAAKNACCALNAGRIAYLDVGLFGKERYFTYVASFGAFASSSYSAPQSMKNALGHLAYILQGVKDFFQIKPIKVSCRSAEGKAYSGEYIFGGVTNSTSVGGIVKLNSELVDMSDGEFEVVLVKNPRNMAELNKIVTACLSSNLKCDMIEFFKTREIAFAFAEDVPWTLDGEEARLHNPVITNLHKKFPILK